MSGVGLTGNIKPLNGGNFTVFNGNPVPDLATLSLLKGGETGTKVWVQDQAEFYQLEVGNTFALSSPLIVAAAGGGRWFRRSKKYVVGNFTLWVVPFGGPFGTLTSTLVGFTPGQLLVSAATVPDIILTLTASIDPTVESIESVTVDSLGNPWVFTNSGPAGFLGVDAYKFLLKDCLATASITASVKITTLGPIAASTEGFNGIFDKQNNLWLNVGGHGGINPFALFKFNQSSYAQSTSKTADVVITCIHGSSGGNPGTSTVGMMVFDGGGNLWFAIGVTSGSVNGGVGMLSAAQMQSAAANVVPAVEWTGSNFAAPGVGGVFGLCFGPDGLLWTTNFSGSTIRAWDPRSPVTGNPAPAIILTSATFNGPSELAFDLSGNLWVINENDNLVYRIPKASLAASGAVVPDIILNSAAVGPFGAGLTFPNNPDQSGLLPSGVPIAP